MQRLTRNPPLLLLAVAMVAAAVLTFVLTRDSSFYADTWELLIGRRNPSVDTLLQPHNEHLIVFPVLIEELLLRLFGMTSLVPEMAVLVVFLLATAGLVYVYVERRVGPWLALFASCLILFLGPAWEVLLWPFEITFCGPILFGLAMLLALEREDRAGDVVACVSLILALGFSSLGVPFIVAAAVAVFVGPREAWRRRAFVWVVPLLLFAAWYLGWGHDAESHMTLENVLASPQYVADSIAVALGGLTGLGTETGTLVVDETWGRAFVVALVVGIAVWWRVRRPSFDRGLWPIAAAAFVNWFLTGFNAFAGREPTASRYQYAGAIFILLILANLLRDVRPSRNWLIGCAALTALAIAPNLIVMHSGSKVLDREAAISRGDTAALEIARSTVPPEFALGADVAGTASLVNVSAGPYLEAVEEFGSPAYSVAELNAAPEEGRKYADIVLSQALPLATTTEPGAYESSAAADCVAIAAEGAGPVEVPVGPGATRVEVPPGPHAGVSLRRFAVGEYPVPTVGAEGESTLVLEIPPDSASQPWYVHVEAAQGARVCH